MNKLMIGAALAMTATVAFARPNCPGGFHPCPRPMPPPHHFHHHHDFWGRGGRNFWPGFVGGLIGGAAVRACVNPTPVVVQQPVVTQVQNVWVEGQYVDQVQPNGGVVRVWVPGHYEQRSVIVQ